MGSDQSTLPAGAPGSTLKSQRDEDIPYTSYSITKPIAGASQRQPSPRPQLRNQQSVKQEKENTPKHDIVVVGEGQSIEKDPDPELTRLNTIPMFFPVLKGSLNLPNSPRELELLDKLDPQQLLQLCLRYQEHLKQLAEAVAFDQNALCIRIKEIDCVIQVLNTALIDRHKKFSKYSEQFHRVNETLSVLNRVNQYMDSIVPKVERLNQMLPPDEQLEPFVIRSRQPSGP